MSEKKSRWEETQKKAYKNWANYYLRERELQISNLDEDLKDGILLINLVEVLTGKSVGKYTKNPRLKVQMVNNINIALQALARSGEKLENIASAEDIAEGNMKGMLALIWNMVHEFQLHAYPEEETSGKPQDALLDWVVQTLQPYKDRFDLNKIKSDFPNVFKDGRLFNYLVHVRRPNLVNLDAVDSHPAAQNLTEALDLAEKELQIPKLIDVEDILVPSPDERSMLTYLSYFRSTHIKEEREKGSSRGATGVAAVAAVGGRGKSDEDSKKEVDSLKKAINELEDKNKKLQAENSELSKQVSAMKEDSEKLKKANEWKKKYKMEKAKRKALEEELAKEKAKSKDSDKLKAILAPPSVRAGPKQITEKKQIIVEKRAVEFEDLDFDLEELKPHPRNARALEKGAPPDEDRKNLKTLQLQLEEENSRNSEQMKELHKLQEALEEEKKQRVKLNLQLEEEVANNAKAKVYEKEINRLKEELAEEKKVRMDVNLKLEEESANVDEDDSKPRREIVKLKEELEEERKKLIRLEVELDNEKANHEAEMEDLKKNLEKLQGDLKKVQESERIQIQRIKELENPPVKASKDLDERKSVTLLDIEELIRQLYYRDGASLHFEDLDDEHRENLKFVVIVNDIRSSAQNVIETVRDDFLENDPLPKDRDDVINDIRKLRSFRRSIKRAKNEFVKACNALGREYEEKSDLEYQMNVWKEKLVEIALDEKLCRPDNDQLLEDIDAVKALLKKDDTQKEEVRCYRLSKQAARTAVQDDIEKLRRDLQEGTAEEKRRYQGLLSDLKDANKKLETKEKRSALAQSFSVTPEQKQKISKVIKLMVQNFRALFREHINDPTCEQIDPRVLEPIEFLERKGLHIQDILDRKDVSVEMVDRFKDYAAKHKNHFDFTNSDDPYVVAELLKEYFKELPGGPLLQYKRYPEFEAVTDKPGARAVGDLHLAIDDLAPFRRATLTVLVQFLTKVTRYADDNRMTLDRVAEVIGPLILRPFKE